MPIHLAETASQRCVSVCDDFAQVASVLATGDEFADQAANPAAFDTARQLSTVYSLFAGEDLRTLLNGFVDQARAMSMLFAAAGGLIDAQDEAVATALGKAAEEPAGLQSLGLMGSLTATIGMIDAADAADAASAQSGVGGYERVGPEDVSAAPLPRMVAAAEALDAEQFAAVRARISTVATELENAGRQLHRGLSDVLGEQWQGEFATQAAASVRQFTASVDEFAGFLTQVESRAAIAEDGFTVTRREVPSQASTVELMRSRTPGTGAGPGAALGPATPESAAAVAAAEAAAEEQARAVVNTVYSPAVMDANLADLDIPTPYRVVATSAVGDASGFDPVAAWNVDGVRRPAVAAEPDASALAAARGAGGGNDAGAGVTGPGATTTSASPAAADAVTERALLASRAGAVEAGGPTAGTAVQAGPAGGVNAATTAAGAPMAPVPGVHGQQASAGAGGASGIRGLRGANTGEGRARDRGFSSTSGLLGGGGAAAAGAGAGASRMGGAGTLAGLGSGGAGLGSGGAGVGGGGAVGPGGGGPVAGAPGAGSAGPAAAGQGVGPTSSSSTGAAQARGGVMPMGGVMGAGAGQGGDRRGHTPAGYLTNATNTTAIIGEPPRVAPAVLGRAPAPPAPSPGDKPAPAAPGTDTSADPVR